MLYAYCVGVYSSRKIAAACERNLAFLAIVGDDRPDFRTISDFRKDHLEAFADLFVQVLRLAAEAGLVRLGNLAFDGSKFLGHASRHKAMSYGYMKKEEDRLRQEIEALLQQAQDTDAEEDAALGSRRGDELPAELQRREERLAVIAAAKQRLEEQARAEAEAERQRRAEAEAERQRTGTEAAGQGARAGQRRARRQGADELHRPGIEDDEAEQQGLGLQRQRAGQRGRDLPDHRGLRRDGGGQRQAAGGAAGRRPRWQNLEQAGVAVPADEAGQPQKIPATLDSGYFSAEAVAGLEEVGFDPYMATERQKHHEADGGRAAAGGGDGEGADGGEGEHGGRAGVVRAAEGDRGAGVRPDQGGAGLPPLLAAWLGEDQRRMASGVPDA